MKLYSCVPQQSILRSLFTFIVKVFQHVFSTLILQCMQILVKLICISSWKRLKIERNSMSHVSTLLEQNRFHLKTVFFLKVTTVSCRAICFSYKDDTTVLYKYMLVKIDSKLSSSENSLYKGWIYSIKLKSSIKAPKMCNKSMIPHNIYFLSTLSKKQQLLPRNYFYIHLRKH